jgi:hypothetical protein
MELDMAQLDFDSLTIAEMEEIEEVCGTSIDEFFSGMDKPGAKKMKLLRVIAYILTRRDNPDFTFEEAGQISIRLSGDIDPKELRSPSGNGNTTRKAKTRSLTSDVH